MLAKLVALIAHEILGPIVAEYRRLDEAETAEVAEEPVPVPAAVLSHGELSCVDARTERAPGWDHDTRAPVTAQVPTGFVSRTRLLPVTPPPVPAAERGGHTR